MLALALATWLRRVRGEDERGRPMPVHHPLASEMRARAIEGGSDPAPLLAMKVLFGDLGKNARLSTAVAAWLKSLYAVGAVATLELGASQGWL